MIITKNYAQKLIQEGLAKVVGTLSPDWRGKIYAILERKDLQRIDHYEI
jgi:hypothetical protein